MDITYGRRSVQIITHAVIWKSYQLIKGDESDKQIITLFPESVLLPSNLSLVFKMRLFQTLRGYRIRF
jgi:hypothetical protein